MRNSILILSTIFLLFFGISACNKVSSREDIDSIEKLAAEINEAEKAENFKVWSPDFLKKVKSLRDSYVSFADKYPDAPESPEYLYRAALLCQNELEELKPAVDLYYRIISKYPDHSSAADALFMTGWVYNNMLNDVPAAEKAYKTFIEKYPDHKQVRGAQLELQLIHGGSNMLPPQESK